TSIPLSLILLPALLSLSFRYRKNPSLLSSQSVSVVAIAADPLSAPVLVTPVMPPMMSPMMPVVGLGVVPPAPHTLRLVESMDDDERPTVAKVRSASDVEPIGAKIIPFASRSVRTLDPDGTERMPASPESRRRGKGR